MYMLGSLGKSVAKVDFYGKVTSLIRGNSSTLKGVSIKSWGYVRQYEKRVWSTW